MNLVDLYKPTILKRIQDKYLFTTAAMNSNRDVPYYSIVYTIKKEPIITAGRSINQLYSNPLNLDYIEKILKLDQDSFQLKMHNIAKVKNCHYDNRTERFTFYSKEDADKVIGMIIDILYMKGERP